MKKVVLALAAAAVLAGCQKSELDNPAEIKAEFTAQTEAFDAQTKTSLAPGNYVVWSSGDRIAVFQGSTIADEYELTEASAGTATGSFKWVPQKNGSLNGDFVAGTELPCNIAVYPYSEKMILMGEMEESGEKKYNLPYFTLPSSQTYSENSFGNGAFPMTAVTMNLRDHNLKFKNLLGAMKLQLMGTQVVKSIKLEGNNGEKLSGTAAVTIYADNLTPAVKMSSEASTEVTLDCGDGVRLSESVATSFMIALPPVYFLQGFTVTVTDSEGNDHSLSATAANTILRSGILVMPLIDLNDLDNEPEDDATYVEYLYLTPSSLTMMPNTSFRLVADIDPMDVTYPTLAWTSSDDMVASVDAEGVVTAKGDGEATITALAVGGVSASCTVKVKTPVKFVSSEYRDYIDEHGANYGKGTAVAGVIWAPVNCGYEPATADYKGYPYGKLYQWGRKYGQGYDSADASYPSEDNLIKGPVMPSWGSSEIYKDVFFYDSPNWCNTQIDDLWADADGKKTKKDPCPDGWRVPTYNELNALCSNYCWTTENSQNGSYFVGEYTYIEGLPQVFFPAAGYRYYSGGRASYRGSGGYYWSSSPDYSRADGLSFNSGRANLGNDGRASGFSVRCVQD